MPVSELCTRAVLAVTLAVAVVGGALVAVAVADPTPAIAAPEMIDRTNYAGGWWWALDRTDWLPDDVHTGCATHAMHSQAVTDPAAFLAGCLDAAAATTAQLAGGARP